MMGRPTKLTAAVQKAICESIRGGNYADISAQAAGITKQTFYDWLKRGAAGDQPYSDFADSVQKARAIAQKHMVQTIQDAAIDTWTAAAWWLERTYPIEYGRQRIVVEDASMLPTEDGVNEADLADSLADAAEAYLAEQVAAEHGED